MNIIYRDGYSTSKVFKIITKNGTLQGDDGEVAPYLDKITYDPFNRNADIFNSDNHPDKGAFNGFPRLEGHALELKHDSAGTFPSYLYHQNTLERYWKLPNRDGFIVTHANATDWIYTFPNRSGTIADNTDLALKQSISERDYYTGYVGLTDHKINFNNNDFSVNSFLVNDNITARTYTFQDSNGTIAHLSDVVLKQSLSEKDASGGYVGKTAHSINFLNGGGTITSLLTNANSGIRTYTFPDRDGTVALVNPRTTTLGDTATVTPNADTTDVGFLTTTQNFTLANPTGTPVQFQPLTLRIKSAAVRTITWGSEYRATGGGALPTATSGGNLIDIFQFYFNSTDTKWDYKADIAGATGSFELISNRNASGGYVGLTGYAIDFYNGSGLLKSSFTNANTVARTYTFRNRNGTIADDTDLALKEDISDKDDTGGYVGLTGYAINTKNGAGTITSLLTNANTGIRTYVLPDRNGTIADDSDLALKQDLSEKDSSGGYAGLTGYSINFINNAGSFISSFVNTNSAARTYTFQNRNGTILDNINLVTGGTDNAILRADGTGGATTQAGSGATISDIGAIVTTGTLTCNTTYSKVYLGFLPLGGYEAAYTGLWLNQNAPDAYNFLLLGDATATYINAPSSSVQLRVSNLTYMSLGGTGAEITNTNNTTPAGSRFTIMAGTTSISQMKFTSAALKTTPVAGDWDFLTDKLHFTITTGAARKEITLNNIALTSGRVPFATTNGRLTDDADLTFDGTKLTCEQIKVASANGLIASDDSPGISGSFYDKDGLTITVTDGLITSIV